MIWTKIAKLEVWWHPPMMPSATIPTTVTATLSPQATRRGVFLSSFTVTFNGFFRTMALHRVRQWDKGGCSACSSSEKRDSRASSNASTHVRCKRGRRGDGKPFLEIQGAYREPWAGVKIPSVCLVHTSPSLPVQKLFTRQSRPICMLYCKHKNA